MIKKLLTITGPSIALLAISTYVAPSEWTATTYVAMISAMYVLASVYWRLQIENQFVMVGYLFWLLSYVLQIYEGLTKECSAWPFSFAVFYLFNEFFVSFTSIFEQTGEEQLKKPKYETPLYVRVGYALFLSLDVILNCINIWYGTGETMDELGVFPLRTVRERLVAFAGWTLIWVFYVLLFVKLSSPRVIKYSTYAIHFIAHCAMLRLHLMPTSLLLQRAVMFQIFGNVGYAIRAVSPTLPSPRRGFKLLATVLPIFCMWTATEYLSSIQHLSTADFRFALLCWMGLFWGVFFYWTRLRSSGKGVERFEKSVVEKRQEEKFVKVE